MKPRVQWVFFLPPISDELSLHNENLHMRNQHSWIYYGRVKGHTMWRRPGRSLFRRGVVRLFNLLLAPFTLVRATPEAKTPGGLFASRLLSSRLRDSISSRAEDCTVATLIVLLVGGAAVCLQLELYLFRIIDHYVCKGLLQREVPTTAPKVHFLPSDQIIVRAVYLDPRPRNGFLNTSVFLVEIRKGLLAREAVVACGTASGVSTAFTVRMAGNSRWAHETEPYLTHDVAMIDCFGLPPTPSGSRAFLWYERSVGDDGRKTQLYRVESEQRYFVPLPKRTHNEDDLRIVVCMAVVRDVPSYMKEFLRYYKYLGVDHVYMVGEDSFFRNGIVETDAFVQKALTEDFISFTLWHQWLSTEEVFYHSQMLAHQDCIYRFQGTFDYAFLVDSDDHFIPLVPERNTLDFYVERYCRFGSCVFPWVEYFPDCGQEWEWLGSHGNVTNTLVSRTHNRRVRAGKSIHRLSAILDAGTHKPQLLLQGYHHVFVPPSIAYVAHIRRNRQPPNGLKSC